MAAVEKMEGATPPEHFFGHRNRALVQIAPKQPTSSTDLDIEAEKSDTITVSGFFFRGGLELNLNQY